ncbi:MAG TPA: hypothetical protein VEC99_14690, partial [Clostridia bacterium]|nr:hypothetical protein [Clostridia bacterium]
AIGSDGVSKWTGKFGSISSSPIIAEDGSVYLVDYGSDKLIAASPTGTNLWGFRATAAPYASFSSPTIGPEGTIYFCSGPKMYALYSTNTLMNSSWPMFRGNVKHTARATQRGLQTPFALPDGNIAMNLTVETGRTYQVEYSADLVNWSVLTNFVPETFNHRFTDVTATNFAQRHYRLGTGMP